MKRINSFIKLIYDKEEYSFSNFFRYHIHKRKVKKFKKNIYDSKFDLSMLNNIAEFIKYAETVFFFDNSFNNTIGLYSSRNYEPGENGFKISNSPYSKDCDITVKLISSNDTIYHAYVEVKRKGGSQTITTFEFDGDNDLITFPISGTVIDNYIFLDKIIDIIYTCALQLFDFCYENRAPRRFGM